MTARQHAISIKDFAESMLESDSYFADRIQRFENRFGTVDADTLAVLAQVTYFCWYIHDYENDFVSVCRAIGTGKPTSFFLKKVRRLELLRTRRCGDVR